jgi:hypothetical protein
VLFQQIRCHGGRRGDTAQALARWLHKVASSEAPDVIHRAMRPASYRLTRMAIKIAVICLHFSLSSIRFLHTT